MENGHTQNNSDKLPLSVDGSPLPDKRNGNENPVDVNDDVIIPEDVERDTRCGIGDCSPQSLQVNHHHLSVVSKFRYLTVVFSSAIQERTINRTNNSNLSFPDLSFPDKVYVSVY